MTQQQRGLPADSDFRDSSLTCSRSYDGFVECYLYPLAPSDTMEMVVLKFGTKEQSVRRNNRLWREDNLHIHSHLLLPLGSCLVRPKRLTTDHSMGNVMNGIKTLNAGDDNSQNRQRSSAKSFKAFHEIDDSKSYWTWVDGVGSLEVVHVSTSTITFFPAKNHSARSDKQRKIFIRHSLDERLYKHRSPSRSERGCDSAREWVEDDESRSSLSPFLQHFSDNYFEVKNRPRSRTTDTFTSGGGSRVSRMLDLGNDIFSRLSRRKRSEENSDDVALIEL